MKTLLDKKYSLPYKVRAARAESVSWWVDECGAQVIDGVVEYFCGFAKQQQVEEDEANDQQNADAVSARPVLTWS